MKRSQKSQKNLKKKKNKVGRLTHSSFNIYYKATFVKPMWYWYKNRHVEQWKRTEKSEINIYHQLIFNEDVKTIK